MKGYPKSCPYVLFSPLPPHLCLFSCICCFFNTGQTGRILGVSRILSACLAEVTVGVMCCRMYRISDFHIDYGLNPEPSRASGLSVLHSVVPKMCHKAHVPQVVSCSTACSSLPSGGEEVRLVTSR